jgi:hypothetical protein
MKKWFAMLLVLFSLVTAATPVLAKDNWHQFSAGDAQLSPLGKEKLKPGIKLYMLGEKHAKVLKRLGEFKSNKRSNAFGKSAQNACDRTFISALMALQDRAVREGGNAVIDIYTITKNQKFESAEQYSCIKGGFVTNVALMGTVAELAE